MGFFRRTAPTALLAVAYACTGTGSGGAGFVASSPPSGTVAATDSQTLAVVHALVQLEPRKPTIPANLEALVAEGWGATRVAAGEPPTDKSPPGPTHPASGPNRKRLVRFAHVSDLQLADDESPTRLCVSDGPPPIEGAFRPQEGYGCRMVNAVVKTVNRIHADAPIDMVVLGGDNADNAQKNELSWVLGILNGGAPITCDSGDRNDLVPGPDNDPKDTFTPEGLAIPWLWVTGNHDIEVQGNLVVDAAQMAIAIGNNASGGTRDYSQPGAPIARGQVIADPSRALLTSADMVATLLASTGKSGTNGHGLTDFSRRRGKAFYTYDVPGSPIRFIVLDLACELGGADGLLRREDLDGFVLPEIDRAAADGKLVVLTSHQAADAIGDGTGAGGPPIDNVLTSKEWERVIADAKPVIVNLVGHAHSFRTRYLGDSRGGAWEVQSDAIADFPNQFRLIEIWDEDDGWVSIRASGVDFLTDGDPLAAQARTLAVVDYASGWTGDGLGKREDRNVILWTKKPSSR